MRNAGEREPGAGLTLLSFSSTSEIDKRRKTKASLGSGRPGESWLWAEGSGDLQGQVRIWTWRQQPCLAHSSCISIEAALLLCAQLPLSRLGLPLGEELGCPGGSCGQVASCPPASLCTVSSLQDPGFAPLSRESHAEGG